MLRFSLLLFSVATARAVVCDETRPPTGLGDRLTAFWGAWLYARVNNQSLRSLWRPFSRDDIHPKYDYGALELAHGCEFTEHFFGPVLQHVCGVHKHICLGYTPACDEYINLVTENPWRLSAWPSAVMQHVKFYVPRSNAVGEYKKIARETRFGAPYNRDPAILMGSAYTNLRMATCVHLRASDKIVPSGTQNYVEVDEEEWQKLREWSLLYLKSLRSSGHGPGPGRARVPADVAAGHPPVVPRAPGRPAGRGRATDRSGPGPGPGTRKSAGRRRRPSASAC